MTNIRLHPLLFKEGNGTRCALFSVITSHSFGKNKIELSGKVGGTGSRKVLVIIKKHE